jgi:hypothetical protein
VDALVLIAVLTIVAAPILAIIWTIVLVMQARARAWRMLLVTFGAGVALPVLAVLAVNYICVPNPRSYSDMSCDFFRAWWAEFMLFAVIICTAVISKRSQQAAWEARRGNSG